LPVIEGRMATDFTELRVVFMQSAVPQEEDEQVDEEYCDKVSWLQMLCRLLRLLMQA